MTEQQTTICSTCDRCFVQEVMVWSELTEQPLCPACLAEEESCGCADD